jgi:hypothetical protein
MICYKIERAGSGFGSGPFLDNETFLAPVCKVPLDIC